MDTMPRHGELFLEARKPRVIVMRPEPVWVIDNYRVRTWYYRSAPEVGTKVMYLDDGSYTRITRVSPTRIYLESSCSMRRPYSGARLLAWVLPRLQNQVRAVTTKIGSHSEVAGRNRSPKNSVRLSPEATTIYV